MYVLVHVVNSCLHLTTVWIRTACGGMVVHICHNHDDFSLLAHMHATGKLSCSVLQ